MSEKKAVQNEEKISKLTIYDRSGNEYTLEFNARVVKAMERRGFKVDADYPYTMVDDLFLGAFQMHHKGISPDRVKEIWKEQPRKDELLPLLTKLYMNPLEELMAEPDEENASPTWKAV